MQTFNLNCFVRVVSEIAHHIAGDLREEKQKTHKKYGSIKTNWDLLVALFLILHLSYVFVLPNRNIFQFNIEEFFRLIFVFITKHGKTIL